ncbi:putative membrane protein [Neisseria lactamica ATCC 23970]|nr:putative membrane protein [Neisseria lactamica ATCC 23970]
MQISIKVGNLQLTVTIDAGVILALIVLLSQ